MSNNNNNNNNNGGNGGGGNKAPSYKQVGAMIAQGAFALRVPEKSPGKDWVILPSDGSPSTFQLWTAADGPTNYLQMPYGVSLPYQAPANYDGRKMTLAYNIVGESQQAFIRSLDELALQWIEANSVLLFKKQMSRADIEENKYVRALHDDPAFGNAKANVKSGGFYSPSIQTIVYRGTREINAEGKAVGPNTVVIHDARNPTKKPAPTCDDIRAFDLAIPVLRVAGLWMSGNVFRITFMTEVIVWIANQRQQTMQPDVDFASLTMPAYVEPEPENATPAYSGGGNNGGGGMIFSTTQALAAANNNNDNNDRCDYGDDPIDL